MIALAFIALLDAAYLPPPCNADPCHLEGLGGNVAIWRAHTIAHSLKGRDFIVTGICASACEIVARETGARLTEQACMITHQSEPVSLSTACPHLR